MGHQPRVGSCTRCVLECDCNTQQHGRDRSHHLCQPHRSDMPTCARDKHRSAAHECICTLRVCLFCGWSSALALSLGRTCQQHFVRSKLSLLQARCLPSKRLRSPRHCRRRPQCRPDIAILDISQPPFERSHGRGGLPCPRAQRVLNQMKLAARFLGGLGPDFR